ncbi:MAG: hypothetical protein WCK90_04525 [archaeon]
MNWGLIIVIAVVVVIIFVIMKFKELRHKAGFLVVLFLLLFLGLTFANIYFKSNVDIKTFDGVMTAGKLYFSWLGQVANNIGDVTGYVINQDWGSVPEVLSATNSSAIK